MKQLVAGLCVLGLLLAGCQAADSSGIKTLYVGKGKKGLRAAPFAADPTYGAWFVQGDEIFTIDRTGKRHDITQAPDAEPVFDLLIHDGMAYILTEPGRVMSIDPATGEKKTIVPTQEGERGLQFHMRDNRNVAPGSLAVRGEHVFTVTRFGNKWRIRASSRVDGSELWVADRDGRVAEVVPHGDSVYWTEASAFQERFLYRADVATGRVEAVRDGTVQAWKVFEGGTDLIVGQRDRLYRQQGTHEEELWRGPAESVQALGNGDIFWLVDVGIVDPNDRFCALIGYRGSTSIANDSIKLLLDPCPFDGIYATEGAVFWWGGGSGELYVYEY